MPQQVDQSSDSGSSGANQERILLAKKYRIITDRFFARWDSGDLTVSELRAATGAWFMDDGRRKIFFNLIDRGEKYADGYHDRTDITDEEKTTLLKLGIDPDDYRGTGGIVLDVSPLKSREFRNWYRRELYDDLAQRIIMLHESITTFAWLVGGDEVKSGKDLRIATAKETFKR